ncbi:hypothetical protein ACM66B_005403 [Microbotryomycetes sp. NB124-2]
MQGAAVDSASAASSSTADGGSSSRPFRGFSPPRWIVSLTDAEIDSQKQSSDGANHPRAAGTAQSGRYPPSQPGLNRYTRRGRDDKDDDIPSYGPTLRRRGNVNFVKASGVGPTAKAVASEAGVTNKGSLVKGLYESIVGTPSPALTPPPSLHVTRQERKPTPPPPAVEVDVDLTVEDDDEILIIDSATGQAEQYIAAPKSQPRRYIVPPPAPSNVFNASQLAVADPRPARAIHEMLPANLEPLKLPPNYHLRSNNVGWQMLSRQGWNEGTALGPAVVEREEDESSGSKRLKVPLRAMEKHDRRGLGLESKSTPRKTREEVEAERKRLAVIERDKRGRGSRGMEKQKKKDVRDHKAMLAYMNRE